VSKNGEIMMGTLPKSFNEGNVQDVTFSITEDCNLRCKYCYMVHKNSFRVMSFETAKRAVDYVLSQPPVKEAVIWDFIGGEPTLEMGLIDKITDYIKFKQYTLEHPWHKNHAFFIGTNGVLYGSDEVQKYIAKNRRRIDMGITIDGTKDKHDLQRVKPDGSGSYDDVSKNIPLWKEQFGASMTKVTFASDDLVYLKESIVHLWDMGIQYIAANVVFEDVWKDGDKETYYEQLISLADYIIENKMWDTNSVRFFDPNVGIQSDMQNAEGNYCGTGKMLAIDCDGNFFPCVRFIDFCIANDKSKNSACIGNCYDGINRDKLRPFENLSIASISDKECEECQVSSGCFACAGFNFDDSGKSTIFYRAKYMCEMQKVQVKANKYFWRRFSEVTGEVSPHERRKYTLYQKNSWKMQGLEYLYFLLSDEGPSFCNYETNGDSKMSVEVFYNAQILARERNMIPVYVGDSKKYLTQTDNLEVSVKILEFGDDDETISDVQHIIYVCERFDEINEKTKIVRHNSCVLLVTNENISGLLNAVNSVATKFTKINIIKKNFCDWSNITVDSYNLQMSQILANLSCGTYGKTHINPLSSEDNGFDCEAGVSSYTVAPNGYVYPCPAFYYETPDEPLCHISQLNDYKIEKNLFDRNESPVCKKCDNHNCRRCVFDNKRHTGNVNIPTHLQCEISLVEVESSIVL